MNVLVCDPISPKGIALLQQRPEFKVTVLKQKTPEAELLALVKDVQAMVVRSETKITKKVIDAAPQLRVVGRAGVGAALASPSRRQHSGSGGWLNLSIQFFRSKL